MSERTHEERVAAVVGVGPGLGAALVKALSERGYAVAAMARTTRAAEALAAESAAGAGRILPVTCDVADESSVRGAFESAAGELGPVDALMYNAAQFAMSSVMETSPEVFERVWRVGCLGGLLCAQQVIPTMVERGAGAIFFTGATASLRGGARFAPFASAKFALRALAQSMARELAPQGVHVAHFIIDGMIFSETALKIVPSAKRESCLQPEAIAAAYFGVLSQDPSAWTHELDLRPHVESW